MKKYKVIANGTEYEVLIELVSSDEAAPSAKPVAAAPTVTPAAPAAAVNAGGTPVKAPLTGTVTTVSVKAGDAVKKGQTMMILEAMKMENEILAPNDGKVVSVSVAAGKQVEAGELLCTLA